MVERVSILPRLIEKVIMRIGKGFNNKIESYITKYLDKSKEITVIDIGSHRGDFINELGNTIEFVMLLLLNLLLHLQLSLEHSIMRTSYRIIENAISDDDFGFVDFKINVYGETSSLLDLNTGMAELAGVDTRLEETIKVSTRRLDSIVKEISFEEIDLIKIDVQGVEHLVLQGAEETLTNTRFIWIELSFKPLYAGSSVFHEIYTIMGRNGFILLELSPGHRSQAGELLQADALFANKRYC